MKDCESIIEIFLKMKQHKKEIIIIIFYSSGEDRNKKNIWEIITIKQKIC